MKILILTLLVSTQALATQLAEKKSLFSLKKSPKRQINETKPTKKKRTHTKGNLPLLSRRRINTSSIGAKIILPKKIIEKEAPFLPIGEVLKARIFQDIIGYQGSVSPVRAIITSGKYKGSLLIGTASIDNHTKRILIKFDHLRINTSKVPKKIKAIAQDSTGKLGISAKYNTNYWQYFWAKSFSQAISGYAKGQIEHSQNQFGSYQQKPGVDTSIKQGLASGAQGTADSLSEKLKSAPEYAVVKGPIPINVFVIN